MNIAGVFVVDCALDVIKKLTIAANRSSQPTLKVSCWGGDICVNIVC
jgi:hypothetical protein